MSGRNPLLDDDTRRRRSRGDAEDNRSILAGSIVGLIGLLTLLGVAAFILVFVFRHTSTVQSLNALIGSVQVAAGTGLTVATDTATNIITVSSAGAVASNTLTESDPLGTQVAYDININTVPDNTWRVATGAGFPLAFSPGVVAGDGGLGNVGNTAWTAPSIGEYAFDAHCTVVPSAYVPNDLQVASIALSLGATTVDPTTGDIPPGGRASLDLSVGSNGGTAPSVPPSISVSGHVHVCPTCLVQVGQSVTLHARLDHTSTAGATIVMGTSGTYGMIASTAITVAAASTTVNGNVALSPAVAVQDANLIIAGGTYENGVAAATARADATTLYNQLQALPCDIYLTGIDLSGLTLTPAVYCFTSSGAFASGTLTLNGLGNPGARFVFKFGSTLTTAINAVVAYTGSAQPCGTFWAVGSSATFGTSNTFQGTVVALTSITSTAGPSSFRGGLFAINAAISMNGAAPTTVTPEPSCVAPLATTASFACHLQVSKEQ